MMPRSSMFRFLAVTLAVSLAAPSSNIVSASIFLPASTARSLAVDLGSSKSQRHSDFHRSRNLNRAMLKQKQSTGCTDAVLRHPLAMAIPGNGIAEQVVVGKFQFFCRATTKKVVVFRELKPLFAVYYVDGLKEVLETSSPFTTPSLLHESSSRGSPKQLGWQHCSLCTRSRIHT